MATHKFRVGQQVYLVPEPSVRHLPKGEYEVVRQLPESDGEFHSHYRIKSRHEMHQRVVKENQLRRSWEM